jgi:hypothetical protein
MAIDTKARTAALIKTARETGVTLAAAERGAGEPGARAEVERLLAGASERLAAAHVELAAIGASNARLARVRSALDAAAAGAAAPLGERCRLARDALDAEKGAIEALFWGLA